jgi:hypothetical protein
MTAPTTPAVDGGLLMSIIGAGLVTALGLGWWFDGWRLGWILLGLGVGLVAVAWLIVTVAVSDAWRNRPRLVVLVKARKPQ